MMPSHGSASDFQCRSRNGTAVSSGGQIPISRLKPDATIPVALAAGAVASDDAVWVLDGKSGTVIRIDAKDNKASAP